MTWGLTDNRRFVEYVTTTVWTFGIQLHYTANDTISVRFPWSFHVYTIVFN